ncbi:MAG: glycoside hydrolase family 25 protein, partial [Desulfomonilaceae bacterium]
PASAKRFSFLWMAPFALSLAMALCPGRALAQRPYGIDVYSGSGFITWTSVKNAGISFAWAKASEGTGYDDGQIINNINNARAAGVLIGAYDYARYDLGISATDEANYFWSIVSPYIKADGTELMPMLDVETPTSLSMAQVSAWVNAWCQQIVNNAAAAGITVHPVIYTYPSYCDTYLDSSVTQWWLWMADLNNEDPQTGAPYLITRYGL